MSKCQKTLTNWWWHDIERTWISYWN
jgi:hypothetical protein